MNRWCLALLLACCSAAGCSGSNFEVAEGEDSAASADDAAAAGESAADSAGSDGNTDDTTDDTTAGDSAVPDTAPPPDDCVLNACKGCSKLAFEPGAACGHCNAGKYVCNGADAVRCAELHVDKKPGDACGTCDGGKYACKDTALVCDDPFTGSKPGDVCGVCNAGKFTCSGPGKTACTDPFTGPLPATACGTCGTLKRACAADGKSATCPSDDANACGGCTAIVNAPGKACGACGGGAYACSGKETTKCVDPVVVAPGSACGLCSTSTYACTSTTATACLKFDDRKEGVESFYTGLGASIWTLTSAAPAGIAFAMQRYGSVVEVTLGLQRHLTGDGAVPGSVQVRLLRGAPNASPALLDTATLSASSIYDSPAAITVKFTSTVQLSKDEPVFIELTDLSDAYNFSIFGDAATGPAHLSLWQRASPTSPWTEYAASDPYLKVKVNGCGF